MNLARFPFLNEAFSFAEEQGADLESLLEGTAFEEARSRGKQRVLEAIGNSDISDISLAGGEFDRLLEIMSYIYARMLVSSIDDHYLTRRYSLAEAVKLNRNLSHILSSDPDAVIGVAGELDANAVAADKGLMMHFTDFLRFSSRIKSPEWKLVNTEVFDGYVFLPGTSFCRVLQNALQDRLEREIPLHLPEEMKRSLTKVTGDIVNELEARKSRFEDGGLGEVDAELFPPCMRVLLANTQNGVNLPHTGRFALTSFLHNLGMDSEEILLLFSKSPDFDESKTLYQIKHITGETSGTEYTAPECATMKSHGICYEPDRLCASDKVNHPLVYYRAKSFLRSKEQKGKGAEGKAEKKDST